MGVDIIAYHDNDHHQCNDCMPYYASLNLRKRNANVGSLLESSWPSASAFRRRHKLRHPHLLLRSGEASTRPIMPRGDERGPESETLDIWRFCGYCRFYCKEYTIVVDCSRANVYTYEYVCMNVCVHTTVHVCLGIVQVCEKSIEASQ